MRLLAVILAVLLLLLQYKLWFGEGGLFKVRELTRAVETQKGENAVLRERNQALAAEVRDLKKGRDAIEERARTELGMIKEGETFFQVVEE